MIDEYVPVQRVLIIPYSKLSKRASGKVKGTAPDYPAHDVTTPKLNSGGHKFFIHWRTWNHTCNAEAKSSLKSGNLKRGN